MHKNRWLLIAGATLIGGAGLFGTTLVGQGSARAHEKGPLACAAPGGSRFLAAEPVTQDSFPPTGPTYPEGIAVLGDHVVTSGPATFGTAGNGSPSQLTVFNRHSGALQQQVPVVGEALQFEHALSELFAWHDHLYAPSTQLGVLRWKFEGNKAPVQQSYSTPFCSATGNIPCHVATNKCPANVRPGLPALPNGIFVRDEGDVYVADSLQGIIWHMPKADARDLPVAPEVVFCSRTLQGSGNDGLALFGANGISVVGDWIYVTETFGPAGPTGPTGQLYRMPRHNPTEQTLELVMNYAPVQVAPGIFVPALPDGIRYEDKSGHMFVVLAGQSQISELDITHMPATEVRRYGRTGPDHPMQNPSTIAFAPGAETAYVSNHAITCCLDGDPNPACLCSGAYDDFGVIEICLDRD